MRGGVITGGLARTAIALVVLGLVVFDVGAVVVNSMQLDDIAGSTLRLARQTWAQTGRVGAVEGAVEARLSGEQDISLDAVEVTRDEIVLSLSRPSRTLVAHRIPPLREHVERTVMKRADLP